MPRAPKLFWYHQSNIELKSCSSAKPKKPLRTLHWLQMLSSGRTLARSERPSGSCLIDIENFATRVCMHTYCVIQTLLTLLLCPPFVSDLYHGMPATVQHFMRWSDIPITKSSALRWPLDGSVHDCNIASQRRPYGAMKTTTDSSNRMVPS